jgi:hypothetical protein
MWLINSVERTSHVCHSFLCFRSWLNSQRSSARLKVTYCPSLVPFRVQSNAMLQEYFCETTSCHLRWLFIMHLLSSSYTTNDCYWTPLCDTRSESAMFSCSLMHDIRQKESTRSYFIIRSFNSRHDTTERCPRVLSIPHAIFVLHIDKCNVYIRSLTCLNDDSRWSTSAESARNTCLRANLSMCGI